MNTKDGFDIVRNRLLHIPHIFYLYQNNISHANLSTIYFYSSLFSLGKIKSYSIIN